MTQQNLWTVLAAIAAVTIPYLLTQSDVVIPPLVKVGLTVANLTLVVLARFSNGGAATTTTTLTVTEPPPPAPPKP